MSRKSRPVITDSNHTGFVKSTASKEHAGQQLKTHPLRSSIRNNSKHFRKHASEKLRLNDGLGLKKKPLLLVI